MICAALPCECFIKPKAASKPRKHTGASKPAQAVVEQSPPVSRPSMKSRMKASAKADAPASKPASTSTTELSLEERVAIRALAPILHPTERRRFEAVIHSVSSSDRATAWRGRRNES